MSYNYNLLFSRIWDAHGEWICYGIYIIPYLVNLKGFSDVVSSKGRTVTSAKRRSRRKKALEREYALFAQKVKK